MASIPSAKARASGVAVALTGATCRRPSRSSPLQVAPQQPAGEAFQPPVEFAGSGGQPFIRRCGQLQPRRDFRDGVLRQQVAVEATVAGRAFDPNVARAQLVAQRRQDGRLVKAPVRPALLHHQASPLLAERHGRARRHVALAGPVEVRQQLERGQHGVTGAGGPELQRLDQGGGELAKRLPAVGGAHQRVLAGKVGQLPHLVAHLQQLGPAHGVGHGLERVGVALLRRDKRLDGAVKQPHESPHVAGAGGIPAPGGVACLGEQAADQLVGHVQHRVRQSHFEVEHCGHQDRVPPVLGIAPELMGVRRVALAHELLQPVLVDAAGVHDRHANSPDKVQTVQQLADMVGLGRDGHGLEPGEGRHAHERINDQQPIQLGQMFSGQPGHQGIGRPLAGTRPAGNGNTLDHGRAWQDDAGSPQGRDDRRGDGLSALGAAGRLRRSLDHRRQVGQGRRVQAQGDGELARVVRHGLRATGVLGEGRHWYLKLVRHPEHEDVGRLVEVGERRAGMTQQGELHGAAEAVGVAAAFGHEAPICPG